MNRYLTEFLGTFFLTLVIGLCVSQGVALAPLVIGTTLMTMVFMGGLVSGAHYNPAVSIGVFLRGRLSLKDLPWYLAAQIVGGFAAAAIDYAILGKTFNVAPGAGVSLGAALLVETLFTFMLVIVVLNVATVKSVEGNSYYGLAIGSAITVAAFAGGGISGGAFNPAVGLAGTLFHAAIDHTYPAQLWLYVVGPILGGALAAVAFKIQHPNEGRPDAKPV